MADSGRQALTSCGMGTPKSPRMNEAASGAAAARPFVQRLRCSGDEGEKILDLVKEAERVHDNLYALSEIYGVAVEVYAKARDAEDYDLSDLSVKRMRVLCRLSPSEAREFHNRLRAYSTGRADARMYEARAAMEERLGDTAKAVKMLQEGLRVGAQPEEALRRQLKKLQPTEPQQSLTPRRTAASASQGQGGAPTPPRSSFQAPTPTVQAPQPLKPATPPVRLSPAEPAAGGLTPQASAVTAKPLAVSTLRPRSLGGLLGPPTRRLADGDDDEEDEEEDEEEGDDEEDVEEAEDRADDEEDMADDVQDGHLSSAMSVPLSPIQEQSYLEEASCESIHSTDDTRASVPPPGSTAPTPRREALNACTPRSEAVNACTPAKNDLSIDAGTPSILHSEPKSQPTPTSGSGKSIYVNNVAYSKIRKLGQGGSSKVFLVHNSEGEELALKRVETDCPKQFDGYMNEVDLLFKLKGHEHVIQVIDAEVDREAGKILIVMEAGDIDLNKYLCASEPLLGLLKLQNIWRQMLQGLQVIHNARIVHSDLKPGNFVLVRGKLKVIDFGIAKRIQNDTTNICRDNGMGTLSYMAPEALKTGKLKMGRASDIWSLGIILFQMVYNHLPFAELEPVQRLVMLTQEHMRIEFPEDHCLAQHSSTTKAQLLDILGGCLQRDPRRRPSLSHLLAHPFLRTSAEVQRETLEGAVSSVMGNVARLLGEPVSSEPDEHEWLTLADEVWHRVSAPQDSGSSSSTPGAFEGLASVSAIAARLRRERDSALTEAARHKARNAELEEQLRRLQLSRGLAGNELKDRGQLPRRKEEDFLKENVVAGGAAYAKFQRGLATPS